MQQVALSGVNRDLRTCGMSISWNKRSLVGNEKESLDDPDMLVERDVGVGQGGWVQRRG